MRPNLLAVVLSNFLLLLALPPAAVAQDEILAPGFANGIPYLSGGIGDEEREAIDRARNNYNIKLVLAEASGSYVSDVTLHITTVLTYDDRIVLDAWSLDSALLIDASMGATLVVSSISTAPQPGQALVVPRAEAFITTSAWQAPAASTCQHAHTASHTPQPHDNQRSWQGSWNAQPWRAHFETHTYEEQP